MKIVLFFSFLLLFLGINSAYGIADIENKNIIAESQDKEITLSLEFSEYQYSKFGKIIPILHSGVLLVGDSIIEIDEPRTKIMGNSFVIHSKNILIYAKGVDDDHYLINSYLIGGNELTPIPLVTVPPKINEGIKDETKPVELIVLVRQDLRTFWNDTYDIEIKVFDKAKNPKPRFYESLGAVNQAEIIVSIKNFGGEKIVELTGKTNSKGYWEGDYFVKQNLVNGGTYIVEVEVSSLHSNNFQKFETFIIADTRDSKGSD